MVKKIQPGKKKTCDSAWCCGAEGATQVQRIKGKCENKQQDGPPDE